MISYKKLGFVNTRQMFKEAYTGKYVIGAFNFVCLEQMQAITAAAMETHSPFIMQCSANVRKYIHPIMAMHMATACVEIIRSEGLNIPMAISIGTSHGWVKILVKPGEPVPRLRFDILSEIEKRLPGFPIVLHGSSSIPQKYVDMINHYGGKLNQAQGIPVEQIKQVVKTAVCKINIASDGWIAMTAVSRKALADNPSVIDPRKFLAPAREAVKEVYIYKMREVFNCAGKA